MPRKVYQVRVVTRNGRKYVILSWSLYKDLIKLIDEILSIYEELERLEVD